MGRITRVTHSPNTAVRDVSATPPAPTTGDARHSRLQGLGIAGCCL